MPTFTGRMVQQNLLTRYQNELNAFCKAYSTNKSASADKVMSLCQEICNNYRRLFLTTVEMVYFPLSFLYDKTERTSIAAVPYSLGVQTSHYQPLNHTLFMRFDVEADEINKFEGYHSPAFMQMIHRDYPLGSMFHEMGHYFNNIIYNSVYLTMDRLWDELLADYFNGICFGLDNDMNPATADIMRDSAARYWIAFAEDMVAKNIYLKGKMANGNYVYHGFKLDEHPLCEARAEAVRLGIKDGMAVKNLTELNIQWLRQKYIIFAVNIYNWYQSYYVESQVTATFKSNMWKPNIDLFPDRKYIN